MDRTPGLLEEREPVQSVHETGCSSSLIVRIGPAGLHVHRQVQSGSWASAPESSSASLACGALRADGRARRVRSAVRLRAVVAARAALVAARAALVAACAALVASRPRPRPRRGLRPAARLAVQAGAHLSDRTRPRVVRRVALAFLGRAAVVRYASRSGRPPRAPMCASSLRATTASTAPSARSALCRRCRPTRRARGRVERGGRGQIRDPCS